MWFWILGCAGALLLYNKSKANAAATAAGGQGLAPNPLQTFWSNIVQSAKQLQNNLASNAQNQASSIIGNVTGNGGGTGPNSPTTSGSGTPAPQPNGTDDGGSTDTSYGGTGMSYGDPDDLDSYGQ